MSTAPHGIAVNVQRTVTAQLVLDENAARWLKSVMQNPLPGEGPGTECNRYRSALWHLLDGAGVR